MRSNSDQLAKDLHLKWLGDGAYLNCKKQNVSLKDYTSAEHAQIRIFNEAGVLLCTQKDVKVKGVKALPATPSSRLRPRPGPTTRAATGSSRSS